MVLVKNKFSLIIEPSREVIMQVDYQKQKLGNLLNAWYHSKNAKAHITIAEFLGQRPGARIGKPLFGTYP